MHDPQICGWHIHARTHPTAQTYKLPYTLRETYISEFGRILTRKAVAVIKYIEAMM